jgi:hypothetical protein
MALGPLPFDAIGERSGVVLDRRGETLSLEEFAALADAIGDA